MTSEYDLQMWEETLKSQIRIAKGEKQKYEDSMKTINYNTRPGQNKGDYHLKRIAELNDEIDQASEELNKVRLRMSKKVRSREIADLSLKVKRSTGIRLKEHGSAGDTMDSVIVKLLDFYDDHQ